MHELLIQSFHKLVDYWHGHYVPLGEMRLDYNSDKTITFHFVSEYEPCVYYHGYSALECESIILHMYARWVEDVTQSNAEIASRKEII